MSATAMMDRIAEVSPRFKARVAGALYFSTLLGAAFLQWLIPNGMTLVASLIEIAGMSAVTLTLYEIFKPVNRNLALIAAGFNFVGIALEAIRLTSHGTDIAMVFHGIFCLLTGFLIFRSTYLPRFLGVLIAFGGFGWLTYLTPSLASSLSPYNLACGLGGEVSMFLWLLIMGVNDQRWNQQRNAMEGRR
jgi:hypothetical protein